MFKDVARIKVYEHFKFIFMHILICQHTPDEFFFFLVVFEIVLIYADDVVIVTFMSEGVR